jgi:hypothetical protein
MLSAQVVRLRRLQRAVLPLETVRLGFLRWGASALAPLASQLVTSTPTQVALSAQAGLLPQRQTIIRRLGTALLAFLHWGKRLLVLLPPAINTPIQVV